MKKYIRLLGLSGILFSVFMITNVSARIIGLDELIEHYNNGSYISQIEEMGSNIEASYNEASGTIDVNFNDEYVFSFVYGTDYVLYDNRDISISDLNENERFMTYFSFSFMFEAILSASGYNLENIDADIFNNEDSDIYHDYDKYGLLLETENYTYTSPTDGSVTSRGDVIRYIKMSLDTDKIDAFYDGCKLNKDEKQEEQEEIVPSIDFGKVTNSSVEIIVTSDVSSTCNIYRALSKDGTYEKINDTAVECNEDGVSFFDNNLKSNTKYYYKVQSVNSSNYSNVIDITTEVKTETKTDGLENPNTGAFVPLSIVFGLIISNIVILKYVKKNRKFNRI